MDKYFDASNKASVTSLHCTVGKKWGSGLVTGLKSSERLKKVIYGYKNNNNPQKT